MKPEAPVILAGRGSSEPARYVVNNPFRANVYDSVGILRAWPGPEIEVTCSRRG